MTGRLLNLARLFIDKCGDAPRALPIFPFALGRRGAALPAAIAEDLPGWRSGYSDYANARWVMAREDPR